MKHGPRKPCHASSVRATTSKECFSQKAGYESSFHKGTDFGGFPLTTSDLIPYGIRSKRRRWRWRCQSSRCRCCTHSRSRWSCSHKENAPTTSTQDKTTVSRQDPQIGQGRFLNRSLSDFFTPEISLASSLMREAHSSRELSSQRSFSGFCLRRSAIIPS